MQPVLAPPTRAQWHPVIDPVCGRQVEPVPIAWHVAHGEEDYYFCSMRCAERFRSDPAAFAQRWVLMLAPVE